MSLRNHGKFKWQGVAFTLVLAFSLSSFYALACHNVACKVRHHLCMTRRAARHAVLLILTGNAPRPQTPQKTAAFISITVPCCLFSSAWPQLSTLRCWPL